MKKVALIIPCYNEGDRLDVGKFKSFLSEQDDIHIVFVNDGSKDNTLEVLQEVEKVMPHSVSVFDMPQNGGKAEAVRNGMLFAMDALDTPYLGFLDADLSTTLEEFSDMTAFISQNDFYQSVIGSRMTRMGANVKRKWSRKVFSTVVSWMIYMVSKLPINDTQCGAKIFSREMAETVFAESFETDWLFDVEIFVRIRQTFGRDYAKKRIYEYPLMRWVNAEGSKVSMKEIYRTPTMISKIGWIYNMPRFS